MKNIRRLRAFTLVELLTVLAILAVLGVMLATLFGTMDRAYRTLRANLDYYGTARQVFSRMSRELGSAVYDADDGLGLSGTAERVDFHAIISVDALTQTSDSSDVVAIGYAPDTNDPERLMRYLENATAAGFPVLPAADPSGGAVLADSITNLSFEYFESAANFPDTPAANWDAEVEAALPALIRVRITVRPEKAFGPGKTFETLIHPERAP